MEKELLNIFDEDRNQVGVATREEVHKNGYWHETFHCWFVSNEKETDFIYLQLRSDTKKDFPNLLDITAAGHLLAHETVQDGVREVKEELGIDVPFHELIPLGVMDYCVINDTFIDKELANVFLYKSDKDFDFTLQEEEVSGIVKVKLDDFMKLWSGEKDSIEIKGFAINENGNKCLISENVSRDHFVPHPNSFYQTVIQRIIEKIG